MHDPVFIHRFISGGGTGTVFTMVKSSRYSVPVYSYLTDSYSNLGRLIQHGDRLRELESRLTAHLEPPLNQHCQIANYANNTLTLHTDSPTWAAKLRFITPDILNFMRNNCSLSEIKTVRIRIMIPDTKTANTAKHLTLSPSTADHIKEVALSVTDDGLRHSLLKLSKHRK